jgi:hypothetical protein
MRRSLKDNGLSIAIFGLFLFSFVGQFFTGYRVYNDDQKDHHQPPVAVTAYLTTGHFVEAVFENWESEFLQMGAFILLTSFLYQKGSPESKDPDGEEEVDEDPEDHRHEPGAPVWVRRGGLYMRVYSHSLTLALFLLFLLSFSLHAAGGAKAYNEEQKEHGGPTVSTIGYLGTSRMWFESFQNWQSEFLSIWALIVLSIYLRQKGSAESKPVHAPHEKTGTA